MNDHHINRPSDATRAQQAAKAAARAGARTHTLSIAEASAAQNAWASGQLQRGQRATSRTVAAGHYSTRTNSYQGHELRPYTCRPGSLDFLNCPSLIGSRRIHRADAACKGEAL
jgi:hypothetical protein